MVKTSYSIANLASFQAKLREAQDAAGDLTEALEEIAEDWYRSERATFQYRGAGPYRDLTQKYKVRKRREVGAVYPILVRSGRLGESMTEPGSPDAVTRIEGGKTLVIDSRVPYAPFVQKTRPFFFIGPEARQYATPEQLARPERWKKILTRFVLKKCGFSAGRAA